MTGIEKANAAWAALCLVVWLCRWLFPKSQSLTSIYEIVAALSYAAFFLSAYFTISAAWNGEWENILSFWAPLVIIPAFLVTEKNKPRSGALIAVPAFVLVLIGGCLETAVYSSQRDASYSELLSGAVGPDSLLHESSGLSSAPVRILRRGHFVILQSERNNPQALHYSGNHGFPVPASPADVHYVIVVVRRTVSLAPPAGGQWVFDCTAVDVRSKQVLAFSTVAGDNGNYQALGDLSMRGEQPWSEAEHWVSTLIVQ